jgi:hypothetical protein
MSRHRLAFVVAPLWVPVLVGLYCFFLIFTRPGQEELIVIAMTIGAILSYGGTLAFGRPAFAFMRTHRMTSIWMAMATGFAIGALTSFFFLVAIAAMLQGLAALLFSDEALHAALSLFNVASGIMGTLVGITLWLIARPDRATDGVTH